MVSLMISGQRTPIRSVLLAVPVALWLSIAGFESAVAVDAVPDAVSFSRQIRPLLSDRCFQCHGPDSVRREADLRFDQKEGVLGDRGGRPIVIAGAPQRSELIARIHSTDADWMMPPPDSGKSLSTAEAGLIEKWIEQGAHWEEHWAWIPPERPTPPHKSGDDWSQNEIDHFVFARLDAAGIVPMQSADRRTLIRRVTQDLTGLPPTPAEIDSFLNDDGEDAWETVADRLLNSARYGEKMALPWLEAARYADTSGFTEDYGRFMYPWRTWVIDAFNSNMPYDEFVTDQMAGDLRPNATPKQILATSFNRNHQIYNEVGALDEEFIVEYAIDRLETVGTVFMGMTIGCARCHDHKYDPVTQKEFYQLYAFLNNNDDIGIDHGSRFGFSKPFIEWPTTEQVADRERLLAKLDVLKNEKIPVAIELEAYREWLTSFRESESIGLGDWYSLGPFAHEEPTRITGFTTPYFAEPDVNLQEAVHNEKWTPRPQWKLGTVMVPGGEFSTIYLYREVHTPSAGDYVLDIGASDSVRLWVNGTRILDRLEEGDNVATPTPFTLHLKKGRNRLLFKMSNGDFVQQITFRPQSHQSFPDAVFQRLKTTGNTLDDNIQGDLYKYFHQTRIDAIQEQINACNRDIARVMIMKEREDIRPAYLLERGNYEHPGEQVERNVPAMFPAMPDEAPRNRMGLAQWLTSPDHPLTARVAVNRIWQNYFGHGIVRTEEDFGVQGEYPTHPDLLDWLATEFVRSGWNVKEMHRLIVMSATYRQSAAASAERRHLDPENRLLSRGARFRLRPQEIRDQALFVSGLITERLGGASVFPYQPPGLWSEITSLKLQPEWFLTVDYKQDHGPLLYRRSVYTFWKRSVPPPNMTVFDAETREVCVVRRQNSNTPLQAMNLLNDVTYVEAARHLAHRMLSEGGESAETRIDCGLNLIISRNASSAEQKILRSGLSRQLEDYHRYPDAAKQLLASGESGIPGNHDPVELAAWTQIALLMLNLDEAITRN